MHVDDRWTKPGPSGRRVHNERWGRGQRWRARWTDPDGKEREKSCATRDEAESLLAKLRVDVAQGTYISPTAGRETFRSYAERWRTHQLHYRPSTVEQAESRLRVHVYPAIGDRPLGAVRRSDVQALISHLAENLAPSTVEVVYSYISAVFKAAVDDRLIGLTPCSRIKLPELVRQRVRPLTEEQVARIRDAVPARYRAMVVLCAASGLRSGELRGLTLDRISPAVHVRGDVEPAEVTIRVDRQLRGARFGKPVFGPPKTPAADREVRVGPTAARALRAHLDEFGPGWDGVVFSTRRKWPVLPSTAGQVWRDAVAGMGLPARSGWHQLRHFHASLLIADGLSVRAVADRLGHADPAETLRVYSHLWPTDEGRAVAAAERALGDH